MVIASDEGRDRADAPLRDANERQRQQHDDDGARDERRARLDLVHPDVLAQDGRHDPDRGAAEHAPREGHPADPAQQPVPPQRRDAVGHVLAHERSPAPARAELRHEPRIRAPPRRARRCRPARPSAPPNRKSTSPTNGLPNTAAWLTVVRIAWARRSAVVLRRVPEAPEDRALGEVARRADDDRRDEDEPEPVLAGERGQRIERARSERDGGHRPHQPQRDRRCPTTRRPGPR